MSPKIGRDQNKFVLIGQNMLQDYSAKSKLNLTQYGFSEVEQLSLEIISSQRQMKSFIRRCVIDMTDIIHWEKKYEGTRKEQELSIPQMKSILVD